MATMRLLQHRDSNGRRRVIVAEEAEARFVGDIETVRDLAWRAIETGTGLADVVRHLGAEDAVDLAEALDAGRLIAPIDHDDAAHLTLTGTGLTHLGSAKGRDQMHRAASTGEKPTDSMRMFLEGLEGGKPAPGTVGQQPEWFYKGDGSNLVGPGLPLAMPAFALDGGEEPELAGVYLIGPDGAPCRLGFCLANEFSDHVTERHNYLWLAHSKLRPAALGPELLVGEAPRDLRGTSRILRDGQMVWEKPFLSGEDHMSHSLANLEHHHFKYAQFRRPGDIHVHFFGTATLSFSDGFQTRAGDVFEIEAAPFSLPLRNSLHRAAEDTAWSMRTL